MKASMKSFNLHKQVQQSSVRSARHLGRIKIARSLVILILFCSQYRVATAQSDTAVATERLMFYADSLVRSAFYQNWKNYLDLSMPSAIKYYGGKDGFQEHVATMYYHNEPTPDEKPEKTRLVSLMNDGDRWQAVVEKIRYTTIDQRRAMLYSHLIGASYDNGLTWKFVDVGFNTNQNIIYIVPDIFGMLAVPTGKTVFEDEVMAAEQPVAPAPPKKAVAKKPKK